MGLLGPMGPGGFMRRGRRRGLVVGAAVGSAAARRSNNKDDTQTEQTDTSSEDQYAELEKLAKLKDNGIITEEEFTEKKKQILGL